VKWLYSLACVKQDSRFFDIMTSDATVCVGSNGFGDGDVP
jgi:hypothetical protein